MLYRSHFVRGDIQQQWLLVEMVSLSGSGGRWEVMMKLLSFILLPCPHFALKVKKKNIQSVRLKGDSTLSFSCCATLVKIQTNAFRIFIPGKKNIWFKSKFYTRKSYTWKRNIWLKSFEQTILSKEILRSIWRLHILAFQFLFRNRSLHLFLRKGKKVISKQLSG